MTRFVRHVSVYFANGQAQVFRLLPPDTVTHAEGLLTLTIGDGKVIINCTHAAYIRVSGFEEEIPKPKTTVVGAPEEEERTLDLV